MVLTRKKVYLFISITALVFSLAATFLIVPWVLDIFSLSDQIKEQKINLKKFNLKEDNFKRLKNNENEINLTLKNISKVLITKENSLDFIVMLEKVAKETNNEQTIEIIDTVEEKQTKKNDSEQDQNSKTETKDINKTEVQELPVLNFRVNLKGKYKDLLYYLARLENLGIYSDIKVIEIRGSMADLKKGSGNKPFEGEKLEEGKIETMLQVMVFTKEDFNVIKE